MATDAHHVATLDTNIRSTKAAFTEERGVALCGSANRPSDAHPNGGFAVENSIPRDTPQDKILSLTCVHQCLKFECKAFGTRLTASTSCICGKTPRSHVTLRILGYGLWSS